MAKFWWNAKSIIRGFSPILGVFFQYKILILLECAVDCRRNGVINFVAWCSVVEIFVHRNHKNSASSGLKALDNISPTVHATIKSFAPFCSAQDGKSTDMNWNAKSIIRGFSPILG